MDATLLFVINSMLLGAGLAMDAFSVSVVNGICEPEMRKRKAALIAAVYAFFQALMPMTGWMIANAMLSVFSFLRGMIPWLSLILLSFIGGKMIWESRRNEKKPECRGKLGKSELLSQGVATSIDALSVGLTFSAFGASKAFTGSLIIAAVTFLICLPGVIIGKKIGTRLSDKAETVGGIVLILVGIEIFLKG